MDGSSSPVPSGPEGRSPLSASRRYNTDDASDPTTRVRVYKRRESVREVWIQVSLFTFWHILRNLLKMMNSGRIALAFLVAVIATIIFILTPSSVFHCERVNLPKPPKLEGVLTVNSILTKADYLLEHQIFGPESIVVENNNIWTGTQDGMLIAIEHETIRKNYRFGSVNPDLCDGGFDMESKCGRPLGLRQLSAGSVLAIDTYLGIFSVNLE
ncbi:unnamed protein product, partial [Litomosoides sigmodontis]